MGLDWWMQVYYNSIIINMQEQNEKSLKNFYRDDKKYISVYKYT